MIARLDHLRKYPPVFKHLTGLVIEVFDELAAQVAPAVEAAHEKKLERPDRRRPVGGGDNFDLATADQLLLTVIWLRQYPTNETLGLLFGVSDSTASRARTRCLPILERAGRDTMRMPDPGVARRKRRQRAYYSGKKRLTPSRARWSSRASASTPAAPAKAAVSRAFAGRMHDKEVYDRTGAVCPPGARRRGDTAYLGTGLCTPRRRPPKGQLTARQKAGNRRVSRRRVVAEHGIGKMRVWRIAAERFRNPRRRHTLIIKNVAGLHSLMYAWDRTPGRRTAANRSTTIVQRLY